MLSFDGEVIPTAGKTPPCALPFRWRTARLAGTYPPAAKRRERSDCIFLLARSQVGTPAEPHGTLSITRMPSSREEGPEPIPPGERDLAREHPLALVMGGGGARAAYQVGFLRALAKRFPDLEFPIITGVSAGAINAVHMASHPGPFTVAVDDLVKLWESLTPERVFRIDARSLALSMLRTLLQLASGAFWDGRGSAVWSTRPPWADSCATRSRPGTDRSRGSGRISSRVDCGRLPSAPRRTRPDAR
jgi:hypothetical protein